MSVSANGGGSRGGRAPVADLRRDFVGDDDDDARPSGSYANVASFITNAAPPPETSFGRPAGSILGRSVPVPKAKHVSKDAYIPTHELPNSVHQDRTYLLRLTGVNAVKVTAKDICIALISEGALSLEEWEDFVIYYRYESPFERYIHLLPGANFDLLHNTSLSFKPASVGSASPEVEMRLEDLSVKETTFFLEWVPMTYSEKLVQKLLTSIGLRPTSLRRDARSADKWAVTVADDQTEIPHYIYAPRFSLNGQEKGHSKVLVTIPKRWTECEHCRSTSHRSHRCPNKKMRQNQQHIPQYQFTDQPNDKWVVPKQGKTKRKATPKSQRLSANSPLPTFNRFSFPELDASSIDPDTESEFGGDDDEYQSVASTPNVDSSLFKVPTPGTFNFAEGKVNARKASLRKKTTKKNLSKSKAATPSGGGSKKGEPTWFETTPVRRGRPRTPRAELADTPENIYNDKESSKKRPLLAKGDSSKRSRKVSPTHNALNECTNVSENMSKGPPHDGPSVPSDKVAGSSDVVPSSIPEADALLTEDGLQPTPCAASTLGVGSDTGQPSQEFAFDDSQKVNSQNVTLDNNNIPT